MTASLTDTHAHLNDRAFKDDGAAVVQRANAAGIETIVNVGYTLETSRTAVRLAEEHEGLFATTGLHPHDAQDCSDRLIEQLRELSAHPKVVAAGETGLDFFRDLSPREQQVAAFRRIIALAREVSLPLVVHDREAHEDVLRVLEEEGAAEAGGVLHCYSGGMEYLERALALGFYIGIDGPVTYSKAHGLREVAAAVPLERLLLETDCPWLTPKGHGRDRNEPAFLTDVAARVAEVRGMSVDELAAATTENARRLFPKLSPD